MKKFLLSFSLLLAVFVSKAQYTTTNVVTGLYYPTVFTIADDGRYFISLKGGYTDPADNAKIVVYDSNGTLQNDLWDFTDSSEIYFERGVLGVELDPDFSTNHYVYVFYNHYINNSRIRVVRITETNGVGSNPTIILDIADPHTAGNHTGGNIHFGPDGKLYVSIGDRATQANSQDLTKPFGKFLRLNADGTIPTDNPFYDDGNPAVGNDDRIWTYGHRNSFDFTFSTANDSLYASENGLNTWDEVNLIMKGENYGWPTCEGFYNQGSTTNACSLSGAIDPLDDWGAPLPAVTGIVFYDHTLMPEFSNHLLVADNDNGDITDFTLGNAPSYDVVSARSTMAVNLSSLTDLVVGSEGCIYALKGGYQTSGFITRICPVGMSVDEETLNAFSIYPNPATENMTIELNGNDISGKLNITDLLGRSVYSQNIQTNKINIDLASFEKGAYFVIIERAGKSMTQKLIVE